MSTNPGEAIRDRLARRGSLPDDLVARAGSRLGLESEQVRGQVEQVRAAFTRQAVETVGNPVLDWAKANRLAELKDAARAGHPARTFAAQVKNPEIRKDMEAEVLRYGLWPRASRTWRKAVGTSTNYQTTVLHLTGCQKKKPRRSGAEL
jgi:hypothetical protein